PSKDTRSGQENSGSDSGSCGAMREFHHDWKLRSREMRGEQLETSGDPLGVDLANGIVRLPSANPEPRQSDPTES
ncbi:hypothetical protein AB0L82_43065, partial [Nocardia sp. NPDC052001]|uniref:hypothetical protein n=1 Tax=Nocardia sp. NPDC052001 TaxID=3154853 RepID=UPI00342C9C70